MSQALLWAPGSREDKMDMDLSSWSLQLMPERDPSHMTSKGLAGRSGEAFLEEVACTWHE